MAVPVKPEQTETRGRPPSPGLGEIGLTGLERHSGYVTEEFRPELAGANGRKIYREMSSNDPTVGACLMAITMMIRQVQWRVDPGGETPEDIKAHNLIETSMNDMSHSWQDFLTEVLSMLNFGWSYHELVYKRRSGFNPRSPGKSSKYSDGMIGWRKIPIRGQESFDRWEFAEDGGLKGMYQRPPPDYKRRFIPLEKALLFRPQYHKDNPEGRSVLRTAYRPWYFLKRLEEIEAIGIERDLTGLPVLHMPASEMQDGNAVYEAYKKLIRNVRRDEREGVIIPSDRDINGHRAVEFELLTSGGRRQVDTAPVKTGYRQGIAQSMLADFILLGHETVGSFALSSDKTNTFAVALGSWLDSIQETFNTHAIRRLLLLNGMVMENPPVLKHGDIEKPDIAPLAQAIAQLSSSGMDLFPDAEREDVVLGWLSMPPLTQEQKTEREEEKARRKEMAIQRDKAIEDGMLNPDGSPTKEEPVEGNQAQPPQGEKE